MTFVNALDKKTTINYSHVKSNVTDSAVKNLVQCITSAGNRDLFESAPVSCDSAKIITTTTTDIDLS